MFIIYITIIIISSRNWKSRKTETSSECISLFLFLLSQKHTLEYLALCLDHYFFP